MSQSQKPGTLDRLVKYVLTLAVFIGLIWLTAYLSEVLIPFVIAFLLAYLVNPVVGRVQQVISHRVSAVLVTLVALLIAFSLAVLAFTPLVMHEVNQLKSLTDHLLQDADFSKKIQETLPKDLVKEVQNFLAQESFKEIMQQEGVVRISEKILAKIFPQALGILKGAGHFLLGLLGLSVVFLYMVFLLIDYDFVRNGWDKLVPHSWRQSSVDFLKEFDTVMSRHFRAQAFIAFIVGILFAVAFSLIGLPMGILLGLLVGALNMVPYLQVIAIPPAIFLAIVQAIESGDSVGLMVGLTLLTFLVIQVIQDGFLTPKIMGKATGLRPAMILLSLSIWGKLLGILGLMVDLPMTCLLWAYYRKFVLNSL